MLGGNVFGWTLNEPDSFRILDSAFDAGLTFIDTADIYSTWVPGHTGGRFCTKAAMPSRRSADMAAVRQAGLKGMRVGGAEVSAKHANFIIAYPGCLADDVLKLIKIIREKVEDKNQTVLESEVKIWS